jgi:hypothetical protein
LLDRRRFPLPLELNCQIFEYLKFGIQRKFIGGLGRGIYGIFRQKVLTKVGLNVWLYYYNNWDFRAKDTGILNKIFFLYNFLFSYLLK